mgnify:CR=1 FL=1
MKTYNLSAQPRTEIGKKASKLLRNAGLIPVGLIGGERVDLPYAGALKEGERVVDLGNNKGIIVTSLAVKAEDVRKLIYTPEIFAIDLDVNGAKKTAILKEIQFHPVKDEILYIDLLEVNDKKPVVIEVPVKLEGHAEGVKAGGKLALQIRKLKVKALYNVIPERLIVDVTSLGLGKTIKVGELNYEGLQLLNAKEAVVCAVKLTRAARGAQAAAGK